jgi:hypothetical protein
MKEFKVLVGIRTHSDEGQVVCVGLSLEILFFSNLWAHQCYFCRVAALKSLSVHLIKDVIISILEDRSARHICCEYMFCGIFSFFYLTFFNLGGSSIPT